MKCVLVLAALAAAGCTSQPSRLVVAERSAGACIDLSQVTARRVLSPTAVIFETTHGAYRADLQTGCAESLSGNEVVQTDSQTAHLCRDDRVRIYDPVEARATGARSFPQCRIVSITPVPAP